MASTRQYQNDNSRIDDNNNHPTLEKETHRLKPKPFSPTKISTQPIVRNTFISQTTFQSSFKLNHKPNLTNLTNLKERQHDDTKKDKEYQKEERREGQAGQR